MLILLVHKIVEIFTIKSTINPILLQLSDMEHLLATETQHVKVIEEQRDQLLKV